MSTDFPKEYLDPLYWNPQNEGYEIIDWDRWYATEPKVPKVFDPPQKLKFSEWRFTPLYWWNRSWYLQPFVALLHSCCCSVKPEMEKISNGDVLFKKLLKPENTSADAPEILRNHLFWTEHNVAPETLFNFGSWAWRKPTDKNRVIGVGEIAYDFTNDPTLLGYIFSHLASSTTATVQMSPDGKWLAIVTIDDPSPAGKKCNYLFIYVVQEGDEFETVDGEPLDYIKPGDLVRISWDLKNPYETDNDKISYLYFPRRVASINENGQLQLNSPHYDALLKVATNDASDKCCETCCYTCSCFMSPEERFEFQVNHVSDRQVFKMSSAPPTSEEIERAVGNGEDDFADNPTGYSTF